MENIKLIEELCGKIEKRILPLITSDYVLWGLPYYENPGDTLIWEGTLELLKLSKHKCLGTCGWKDYKPVSLKADTVILIIGGGFFGDIWRQAWENVINSITCYPNNPIIILPQSIYYNDISIAMHDATRLAKLKKLTICARDMHSYNFAQDVFLNNILLVPDLAFHINVNKLSKYIVPETDRLLYLKRIDKESPNTITNIQGEKIDESDWPSIVGLKSTAHSRLKGLVRRVKMYAPIGMQDRLLKFIYKYGIRNVVIRDSVRFISHYNTIYTTRLHVMILAFLLGKRIYILDNSYGKVSDCYNTWLSRYENIKIYE